MPFSYQLHYFGDLAIVILQAQVDTINLLKLKNSLLISVVSELTAGAIPNTFPGATAINTILSIAGNSNSTALFIVSTNLLI